jgi:hypothetical protein
MNRFFCLMAMLGTMPIMARLLPRAAGGTPAVAAEGPVGTLDKSWTSGACKKSGVLQPLGSPRITNRRSFATERTGFEPAVGYNPYTGLANRRFRPLSHLSRLFSCGFSPSQVA